MDVTLGVWAVARRAVAGWSHGLRSVLATGGSLLDLLDSLTENKEGSMGYMVLRVWVPDQQYLNPDGKHTLVFLTSRVLEGQWLRCAEVWGVPYCTLLRVSIPVVVNSSSNDVMPWFKLVGGGARVGMRFYKKINSKNFPLVDLGHRY